MRGGIERGITHFDEQLVSEQALPGIFRIVRLVLINEDRPVRSRYGKFFALQLLAYPGRCMSVHGAGLEQV